MSETLPVIVMPDTTEIVAARNDIVQTATTLVVDSSESYTWGAELLVAIKAAQKRITEAFAEAKKHTHAAHKGVLAEISKHNAPLLAAEGLIKGKIATWQQEEERKRRAEEARLREQARLQAEANATREAEERRLAEAERLEAGGDTNAVEEIMEAPLEVAPVVAPPVVLPTTVPKAKGVSMRKKWVWDIVDESQIPRQYLEVNTKAINRVVAAMGDRTTISGIQIREDTVVSVRA
jgi:hypothetical protein